MAHKTQELEELTAVGCFSQGLNCAQALLGTYAEKYGLDRKVALKISSVFGGGIGITGKCGAVNGALILLGARYGNTSPDEQIALEQSCGLANDFVRVFKARHGSEKCVDLIDCDIDTPEGQKKAHDSDVFQTLCPKFIQNASEILEKLVDDFDSRKGAGQENPV